MIKLLVFFFKKASWFFLLLLFFEVFFTHNKSFCRLRTIVFTHTHCR